MRFFYIQFDSVDCQPFCLYSHLTSVGKISVICFKIQKNMYEKFYQFISVSFYEERWRGSEISIIINALIFNTVIFSLLPKNMNFDDEKNVFEFPVRKIRGKFALKWFNKKTRQIMLQCWNNIISSDTNRKLLEIMIFKK